MSSGILLKDDAEAQAILTHSTNILHKVNGSGNHGHQSSDDRGDKKKLGKEGRSEIAALAKLIGVKNTAELMDMSPGQVSNYKKGYVSTGNERQKSEEQETLVEDKIAPVREKIIEKTLALLGTITDEKLDKLTIGSATASAERLGNLYEKLGPRMPNFMAEKQQVIFYAPKQKSMDEYIVKET